MSNILYLLLKISCYISLLCGTIGAYIGFIYGHREAMNKISLYPPLISIEYNHQWYIILYYYLCDYINYVCVNVFIISILSCFVGFLISPMIIILIMTIEYIKQ